jgi:hypothetical protein
MIILCAIIMGLSGLNNLNINDCDTQISILWLLHCAATFKEFLGSSVQDVGTLC